MIKVCGNKKIAKQPNSIMPNHIILSCKPNLERSTHKEIWKNFKIASTTVKADGIQKNLFFILSSNIICATSWIYSTKVLIINRVRNKYIPEMDKVEFKRAEGLN